MILTCPSCATSYFAADDAIGPAGRRVRCQSCGHAWRASTDEPLELTAVAAVADAETRAFAPREEPPVEEALAETPAPELPRAFRARAEQQRRLRRAAAQGAVWAGLASVFVGLVAAGWLFRVEVVEMYPRAAAAYAAVGAPVNPTGLDFEAVSARVSANDPGVVLVSGALRNLRDREITAPPVRLALLDAHGEEIGFRIVSIDAAPVLPGGVQGFAVLIPDPGARAAGVGVDFAPRPDARRAPAEPVAEDVAPPPAPPARPLPSADVDGLRPALVAEPSLRPAPAPVPVAVSGLDSGPVETLSPGDHG